MPFFQTITLVTDQIEAVEALLEGWIAASDGRRTAHRATLTADRDHMNTFVLIVEFPSHEAAMENTQHAETGAFAERLTKLCSAPPTFHNLDVRRVDELA
jgi:quinol monooxygenase YgiN